MFIGTKCDLQTNEIESNIWRHTYTHNVKLQKLTLQNNELQQMVLGNLILHFSKLRTKTLELLKENPGKGKKCFKKELQRHGQ